MPLPLTQVWEQPNHCTCFIEYLWSNYCTQLLDCFLSSVCSLLGWLKASQILFYSIQRDKLMLKPCVVPKGWASRHCDACSFMRADKHRPDGLSEASGRSPESSALKQCWCWDKGDCDWQWETPVQGWAAGQYVGWVVWGWVTTVKRGRGSKRKI